MVQFNKNMENIRNSIKNLKSKNYAFVISELAAMDEYVKGLYVKVLCTIVQYENEPNDMQILFLERIIYGMELEESIEEWMKKGLEISEKDIQEFLSILGENRNKYYFAMNAMILLKLGDGNRDGYEYVAELVELLNINKMDLNYICLIAKSVLQQESAVYNQAKEYLNERVSQLDFSPYIQNYYAGAVMDTDTMKYYLAPDQTLSYDIEYQSPYHAEKVIFENVEIEFDIDWAFEGCRSVVFRNCTLIGKGGKINFSSIGEVRIENCKIKDFTNRFATLESVNNLFIQNCMFIECGYTGDGDEVGGVLFWSAYQDEVNDVVLQENKLVNCYIKAERERYNWGVSGVFIGGKDYVSVSTFTLENNEFIGGSCINNGNYKEAYISHLDFLQQPLVKNNKCSGKMTSIFAEGDYENNC